MKHDTFKLWQFFRLSFRPGRWAEVNVEGSKHHVALLLIDWKRKQFQKVGM